MSVLVRNSDQLAILDNVNFASSLSSLRKEAAHRNNGFPNYTADGAGTILIFHTATQNFVLGTLRCNPALKNETTPDGKAFPMQLNSTIGGYVSDESTILSDALGQTLRAKLFLNAENTNAQHEKILEAFCKAVATPEGWEDKICVHTDTWMEQSMKKTMCYITAVKHFSCTDAEIENLDSALKKMIETKTSENSQRPPLLFSLENMQLIIESSKESYQKTEVEKAKIAYDKFKDRVAVTFNDLAVAHLANNEAFKTTIHAKLNLSSN